MWNFQCFEIRLDVVDTDQFFINQQRQYFVFFFSFLFFRNLIKIGTSLYIFHGYRPNEFHQFGFHSFVKMHQQITVIAFCRSLSLYLCAVLCACLTLYCALIKHSRASFCQFSFSEN